MASKQTSNFGLNQWELSDGVVMEDFNADNRAVDAALQELKSSLLQIDCGSYVGTGTKLTQESPMTIEFDFQPKLIIVTEVRQDVYPMALVAHYGQTVYRSLTTSVNNADNIYVVWGERSISWYTDSYTTYNRNGHTYHYFALG